MKALSKKNILIIVLSISINFLFAQAPTITSFNPASGSIGTLVTITGTNLNNLDTIKIGGVSAIKISAKTDTLVAMVMPGAITGIIYLRNSSGNVTSGSVFTKIASVPPGRQQGGKLVGSGGSTVAYYSPVSVSADGNTAIVGGFGDNGSLGAAWIFTRSGTTWSQQGNKLVGTGNIGASQQGTAVSISADGNTAIIGGPNDSNNLGAAWIFTRSGTTWSQQGNKLVGSGSIGTTIFQSQSVSISADGNTAMIGSSWDNNYQGAVWVFTRSAGIWSQQGSKLTGSGATGSPYFGTSLCLAADGNTAIVGGPNVNSNLGAAWIFTRSGGVWNQQGNSLLGTGYTGAARQGTSVSLSADGNIALLGGINDNAGLGAAWVFTRSGTTWSQQGNKLVGTGSVGSSVYQGYAVSLSADGNTALIGGRNDNSNQGAAWLFTKSGTVWSQQGNKLVGIGNVGAAWQGNSVSLSADGNTAMIGGPQDNSNKGANWIFNGVPFSTNANINSLTISSGILNPVFTPAYLSYTTSVSYNTTNITATLTLEDTTARIKINVNGGAYISATSGNPSDTLSLNIGSNTINIKIIAQDTTIVKMYTITVTRTVTPTITSFTPNIGYIGSLVSIIGTHLNAIDTIKIGSVSAIKISSTDTNLVAMVMPGTISGNIFISNTSGNTTSNNTFTKINSIPPKNQEGAKIGRAYDRYFSPTFGNSVSVSADGNTAVVGLAGDYNGTGAVYIYNRSSGIWSPQSSKLVGTGGSQNRGRSVAISADGNTVIVGSCTNNIYNNPPFGAIIYTRNGSVWSQQGNFLVGTGMVIGTAISQSVAVSISADGNTAIIGGSGDYYYQGAAWIFTRTEGVWSQQGSKLVGTGGSGVPYQGSSVSISADGNTAIVGGYGDNNSTGAVWVYTKNGNVWSQQGNKLVGTGNWGSSNQGSSVSLSANGNTAMVGGFSDSMQMGAVWVFVRSGGIWRQQGTKILGSGGSDTACQGISVSLSADGNTALIGGYKNNNTKGATWVFTRNDSVWSQSGNKLVGTGGTWHANQGSSVSISADGNTAMIGGPNDSSGQGLVWVFNGPLSTNANLNALSLSAATITPVFTVNTLTYSASTTATATTFIATRADSNASIQYSINGGTYITILSVNPSGLLLLNVGNNILNIKVTAQDSSVTKIYTVNMIRNLIAPSSMSYSPSNFIAIRNTSNISSSVTYSGDSITNFSITPALPNGISLNTTTGLISGIPTVTLPQTVFTITGTNISGSTTANFILTVNNIAPTNLKYNDSIIVATRTITNINSAATYSGDAIASFSITPALPIGVTLNTTTGLISGIPTVILPQTIYTITGTNSGGSATANFKLTVNSIAPSNLKYTDSIVVATRTITNINSSATYSGDAIASFSISPSLPTGVSLDTATGLITGIPMINLPLTIFTITGSNSAGNTTASFTLTVNPPLAIQEVNHAFANINCKPNPFNHILEISYKSNTKETTKLIITDAVGKEIFTKNILSVIGENIITIDELTYLKSGIYFARLANNNGLSQSFKLVKE
ncbi:MAG: putative Ig domain-containing protein [Bacteroidia bacterium]